MAAGSEEERARRLLGLIEASADLVAALSLDGKLEYLNGAGRRLLGLEGEAELAALGIGELVEERERRRVFAEVLADALERGRWEGELGLRDRRSGGRVRATARLALLRNGAGMPEGLALFARARSSRAESDAERRGIAHGERLADLAGLRADVGAALAARSSVPESLGRCAEALVLRLGLGAARVYERRGEVLELLAAAGPGEEEAERAGLGARTPLGKGIVGQVAADRTPRVSAASGEHPALAAFPLVVGAELLGVLALSSAERLPEDAASTLALVSDSIAHGIERLRAEARLEEQAEELRRSNADLEQFAYVASHDLQEPLRMISGFSQLLARKYRGKLDADADRYIGHVVGGVARMQRVINDLLAYSRIDRKASPMRPFSLEEALAQTLADLAPAIAEAGAAVTHDPLPSAFGSEDLAVQLLSNLVGNALKFRGAEPPRVHVSARRSGAFWEVAVADNGIGIDPAYFDRIFVIFQRLHGPSDFGGTGIGLAICKKIVERQGGRIWVESRPGEGSTFRFTIPLRSPSPDPAAGRATKDREP